MKSASSQALGGIPPESDGMRSHHQHLTWLVTPSIENETGMMPVPQNYSNHSIK
ncbi:MAG: hypothetical protein F6K65_01715 [Moorea sp. SIO3C2]|nr:hypothetical protein [Moorena sp. SIO3C2]